MSFLLYVCVCVVIIILFSERKCMCWAGRDTLCIYFVFVGMALAEIKDSKNYGCSLCFLSNIFKQQKKFT